LSRLQVKLTASSIPSAVLSHAFSFLDWTVILVSIKLVCWAWNKTQNIRDVLTKVQKWDLERVLSKFAPHGVKEIVAGRCCWACVLKRLCCQHERCSQLRHLALELESSNDGHAYPRTQTLNLTPLTRPPRDRSRNEKASRSQFRFFVDVVFFLHKVLTPDTPANRPANNSS